MASTAIRNSNGDTSEFSQVRQVLNPTAAAVNIEGCVLNETGRRISKAMVSMVDANGNTRTTLTNPFGYYRFTEVQAGETYIFSVNHNSYQFVPLSFPLTVIEEITNLETIGRRRENQREDNSEEKPKITKISTEMPSNTNNPEP